MLTMGVPDHTRTATLVNKGFTPRMISMLHEPRRVMVTQILDRAL
jgi:cytochrome P450